MREILEASYFTYLVLPLATVFFTIFVKIASKNDRHKSCQKEDFAFGFDLSINSLVIFITDSIALANNQNFNGTKESQDIFAMIPIIITIFFILLWIISTIVRKKGWIEDGQLNILWGIIIPNVFGLLLLIFVVNWIGNNRYE